MIAVVTDSSAQLGPSEAAEARISVVPLTVLLDGDELLEGVDLGADEFYERLAGNAAATTSLPSPGRFAELYTSLFDRGADEIVSVHVAESVSGTVGAARLAAQGSPVRVVDSGQASFGVGICALEAATVVARGGSAEDAVVAVHALSPEIGNAFVVGDSAGGRIRAGGGGRGGQVLSFRDGATTVLAEIAPGHAVRALADAVESDDVELAVAVGASDRASHGPADELAEELRGRPGVVAVQRYRVGPSVGAHTGAGTFGVYWWPARRFSDRPQ